MPAQETQPTLGPVDAAPAVSQSSTSPALPSESVGGREAMGGGASPSASSRQPSPNPSLPSSVPLSRATPRGMVPTYRYVAEAGPKGREGGAPHTVPVDVDAESNAPESGLLSLPREATREADDLLGARAAKPEGPGGEHVDPSVDLAPSTPRGSSALSFTPIDASRHRFKHNVLANVLYFIFSAGIQLWFVRYLIDNLGVATYGLVPLATNITNYMAIVTIALSGSVGRFLTIDLASGDIAAANRTFNTSLFSSIALAVALSPLAGVLSWFAPSLLDIPVGDEMGTRFLLMCTCFAFLLNAVGSNFACSTFAKNRFDVQRGIDALGFVIQIGMVVTLFAWVEGDLWFVGAGIAASAAVRFAGYRWAQRRLTPELTVTVRAFDRRRLREVMGMGGWLTINQAGSELFLHVDLLIVNGVLGARFAGLYAPCLQIAMVLRAIAGLTTGVLAPTYVASFAAKDTERMVRISRQVVRFLGLCMAIPIGLVCGLSEPLLVLWLGEEFRSVAPLLVLLVVHLAVNISVAPLFGINQATNRVKWPALVQVSMGLANAGLAIILAGPAGWGIYGVAAAGAIVLTTKNALFTPVYAAYVLDRPVTTFARAMLPTFVVTIAIAASLRALQAWIEVTSLFSLTVISSVATALAAAFIWVFLLDGPGRRALLAVVWPSRETAQTPRTRR